MNHLGVTTLRYYSGLAKLVYCIRCNGTVYCSVESYVWKALVNIKNCNWVLAVGRTTPSVTSGLSYRLRVSTRNAFAKSWCTQCMAANPLNWSVYISYCDLKFYNIFVLRQSAKRILKCTFSSSYFLNVSYHVFNQKIISYYSL